MSGYTSVFGGSTVQPAEVAYRAVALSTSVELDWPALATDDNFLARIMDVTPSDVLLSISVPDARDASPGFDVVWRNLGATSFTVLDAAGNTLLTVASGEIKYLYLTGNSTAAGTWRTFTFGTGTSSADASALAGPGLRALGATLSAASITSEIAGAYTVLPEDRGSFFVWVGGTGTVTLPDLADTYGDWFCGFRNQGSGTLTLSGSANINGASSLDLSVGDSLVIHPGSSQWYTEGLGRSASFNFTQLVKSVTGGTTTLTLSEAANVVQKYTGTLLSNQIVVVPSVVQVYYVRNETSGAYSFTVKTAGVGTTITIPQSQNAILFCDGLNVVNCATTVSGISSLTLSLGSVGAPSLSFGAANTGFYSPATYQLAMSLNGTRVVLATSSLFKVELPVELTSTLSVAGAATFSSSVSLASAVVLPNGSTATTQSLVDNSSKIATTAYVDQSLLLKANLNSPALTGTPTAPTAVTGTATTQIATTAFVSATAFSSALPGQSGNAGKFLQTDGSTAAWVLSGVMPDFVLFSQGVI